MTLRNHRELSRGGLRRMLISALLLSLFAVMLLPFHAYAAEKERKVVRAGWFDSSFCYYDQFGRRCGIDYEYQHKISAYTGWTYEYVEDSWPNLFQMLKDGEIDLLSDVSYKPEREEYISFPDLPMGTESYYIYIDAGNRNITASSLSTLDGTRIGVNAGSVQEGFLKDWAKRNNISLEVVPLSVDEDESMEMVLSGELDGYASIYTFSSEQKVMPVCRIGSSEYYYAVNKNRPDLLAELNMALAGIQDEDPYFNQKINEERLYGTRTNAFLTPTQEDFLTEHGAIRVGYLKDYLPFCFTDRESGELSGALKDYLIHASNNLSSPEVRFEGVPYSTTEEALSAMKAGEIDCVFPLYLSSYDSNERGIRLTDPAMTTEMNAVMRESDNQGLSRDSAIVFAVPDGDINTEAFIMDQYPSSSIRHYPSEEACLKAVASSDADCTLVSNYRLPLFEDPIKKYKFLTVPSGESVEMSFGVMDTERDLYFLLNKTAVMTKGEDMASALASYMHSAKRVSFMQFLKDNWAAAILVLTVFFVIIIFLLLQRLKMEKKANEQQRMMEEGLRRELHQKEQLQSAMEMAYRDPLTGVKSKHAYNEAAERMDERIAEGSVKRFSIIVFDLNDLKVINDSRGHEVGDEYIKDACKLICTCFKHSPVYRIGGDEFTAILEGEDYENQEELLTKFEKQILMNLDRNKTVVAFGCSRFNPQQDNSIRAVFERADVMMYQEKNLLKSLGEKDGEDDTDSAERDPAAEEISVINVRKHILIADDIESNREILGDLLKKDYDIIYASDGVEAIELLKLRKDEIALVILDLYMPRMTGREVMTRMQVDEELMNIPVIFISVDPNAELDCLRIGAMDFIPKPYPDIEIIKARIAKCIELSENRELIRSTQRDKLTGLFNREYFMRYVARYDLRYKEAPFDAVLGNVNQFREINEKYGRQFGDLVLRSIGIGARKLVRRLGGIACRGEGDTFLFYCPHQEDCEHLIEDFLSDLFVEEETASKVTLRFGIYENAQQEPDIEERFVRAKIAADGIKGSGKIMYGIYEFTDN